MHHRTPLQRKIRKLKNKPGLFFADMLKKRTSLLFNFMYRNFLKYKSKNKKFTIVCAVYNVELYLDDFFRSIENQRLDFKSSIEIIMVDDGSPDNSREIIRRWIVKYPNNIFYIRKKNGGQASARNVGISQVSTEWVTFIDPDDFMDENYFYLINQAINQQKNSGAIITKFKLYKEISGTYHDGFQTDFCFTKPVRTLDASNLEDCVQFSSSSAVYKTEIIRQNNIRFDERLTASFEDTKFFYEYLYKIKNYTVSYVKNALYYYRLRANESSSSNNQWSKKAKYKEFFDFGLLEVAELFKNDSGTVPIFIQRLILFSVIPYLQVASINPNRIRSVLNKYEIDELINTIAKCLDFVSVDTIEDFYTPPGNYFWIFSLLSYFKELSPKQPRVYINKFDLENHKFYFRFYGIEGKTHFQMFEDGSLISPYSEKIIRHVLFDDLLIHEYNICYNITEGVDLKLEIDGVPSIIYTDFKLVKANENTLYDGYKTKVESFKNIAVFVDSGYKADDNAEYLYNSWFIEKKIKNQFDHYFYLLDKKSIHWQRLTKKGFNLVDINSIKAIQLLRGSRFIFSSYLPGHLSNWLKGHNFKFQKFVFLQHGIISSNLSKPFNASYSQIYKTIISTSFEREEIVGKDFNYMFHGDDVIMSGIPRLDNLFYKIKENPCIQDNRIVKILVCPTWRSKLSTLNLSNDKNVQEFLQSRYLTSWIEFLSSVKIQEYIGNKCIEVSFCLHPNLYNLLEEFGLNEKVFGQLKHIKIYDPKNISYQDLFVENDLMVTDFSSLHFDFAALNKPVIYYQFDRDDFYGASHAYTKGIFDYETMGFGAVVLNKDELFEELSRCLNDLPQYVKNFSKRREVFTCVDGQSCKRIYEHLI